MNEIRLKTFRDNLPEKAITKNQLAKIESRLPELHRAKAIIGHSTSQASYALQTLNMLDDSPMIEGIQNSMGNALREIGMFQDMYEAIRKSNNIPEVWTEHDFEKQEIANMVRRSFRIGIQSLSNGRVVSIAAVEFWEQLGIHPQSAEAHCRNYLQQVDNIIKEGKEPDVRVMYEFLDGMAEKFKDSYKFALDRIGLKELGSEEFRVGN